MYTGLLHSHSYLRYLVLIALIVVTVKALMGLVSKQTYGKTDSTLGLVLFILTHIQLLIGLLLYFVSPNVQFGSHTMSDKSVRYWSVEHITIMLISVVLITLARTTSKKMTDDAARHKRMFVFNGLALVLIIAGIVMSGRGLF